MDSSLHRFGRVLLGVFFVWGMVGIVQTTGVYNAILAMNERLAVSRSGSGEKALTALFIDDQQLARAACSGPVCTAPTVALYGYRLADFPGATFGVAKLMLKPLETNAVAPQSTAGATESGEPETVTDETPKLTTEDGEVEAVASGEAPSVAVEPAEIADGVALEPEDNAAPLARNSERWRDAVHQQLSGLMTLAVADLGSEVGVDDWVVLYSKSPEYGGLSWRDVLIGRAHSVTRYRTAAVLEVSTSHGAGSLRDWLATRTDLAAAVDEFTNNGFLLMTFKPDMNERAYGKLSAEHRQHLFQNRDVKLQVLPETALDRKCSVDRAPRTACVWIVLADEPVPVQVSVVDLQAGNVAIVERRMFAGKGIAPQDWRQLSAVVRRAWLMQVANANTSILDARGVKVLATPWRR